MDDMMLARMHAIGAIALLLLRRSQLGMLTLLDFTNRHI
jgi:hypothetical protein